MEVGDWVKLGYEHLVTLGKIIVMLCLMHVPCECTYHHFPSACLSVDKPSTPLSPKSLSRPLDYGVKVIAAHCATEGSAIDTDSPMATKVPCFQLFMRLMKEDK